MKDLKLFVLFCFAGISLISCGSDSIDCNDDVFFSRFNESIDELNIATQQYAADPTKSNCEAYVKALDKYIDEISPLRDCAREVNQLTEFDNAIRQVQEAIDDIECN